MKKFWVKVAAGQSVVAGSRSFGSGEYSIPAEYVNDFKACGHQVVEAEENPFSTAQSTPAPVAVEAPVITTTVLGPEGEKPFEIPANLVGDLPQLLPGREALVEQGNETWDDLRDYRDVMKYVPESDHQSFKAFVTQLSTI